MKFNLQGELKKMNSNRPTIQEYFVSIVQAVAARGTCDRGKSGAVIVKDNQIISTGYVGSAAGDKHCDNVGHKYEYRLKDEPTSLNKIYDMKNDGHLNYDKVTGYVLSHSDFTTHCIRTIHAEQNAICQAAKHGHSINGATMYCSMVPCRTCAMMIINSGIKRVIAINEYQTSDHTKELFKQCGVSLKILNNSTIKY